MHNTTRRSTTQRRTSGALKTALALAVASTAACDSLLDVENPNNVVQEDLENATSVSALVNGALALASTSVADAALSTSVVSDELEFTGSQNWAAELNDGTITNPAGRSDALFNALAEARWLTDEAIKFAEEFAADLPDAQDQARAYLYSGIVYMTIADNFEDFAFSDRTVDGPPVGEANMHTVYDTAVERLNQAESLGTGDLKVAATALKARARWAQALWNKLNPQGSVPANPLVDDATANQLAEAALAAMPTADWTWDFAYSANSQTNPQGSWINSRQEFVVGPAYAQADGTGKRVDHITLEDPIDGGADLALQAKIDGFVTGFLYPSLTVVGAREMHLILAEAALAQGNTAEAVSRINQVRALKGASAYDPATHTPSVEEMLRHERRVNLFFQATRRIWDMYRFGETDASWGPASDAATLTGQVFVIGQNERVSNCYILGSCS
ncbi:MAG: RagB/SusD family nutrient uptake outer membrane protein [Gemmatimonadetes bacterium]|nr:RagB/SusD family nutrient uptake outer membrane protein [Gemmatimonadota bacterium]